ncbi:MAG: hypothetical protein JWL85_916 [Candidatus Saccharibacteria bacterium]|nr:hypothetical protein [Candidatus Saccharibacteria bacterium]
MSRGIYERNPNSTVPDYLMTIEQERAQSDALFSSIGEGAVATDEDGRISRINNIALDLLGYTREEVMGKWYPKIFRIIDENGKPIDSLERHITKAMLTGKPASGRTYYLTKTDEKLPVFVTFSPIMLEGKPVGAIGVFRDIKQELKIDRMKTEFISIASHQLRTPLSAIKIYSHMLAQGFAGKLTDDQAKFLDIIVSSISRMNETIDTLLDVSRIEAGKMGVEPKKIVLDVFIDDIVAGIKPLANEKKIDMTTDMQCNKVSVITDPVLIKEVLTNLVSNAIKYTPEGGEVHITLKDSVDSYVIGVADNGYGIPANVQRHLFTKFFRANNIIDKEPSGTGLGLYMIKRIAEQIGGKVWFASEEGKGSTFYFSLPKKHKAAK